MIGWQKRGVLGWARRPVERAGRGAAKVSARDPAQSVWTTPEGFRIPLDTPGLSPQTPAGELFVGVANQLVEQHVTQGRRGLAVCAPSKGAGVSFVATNLALMMAEVGVSTLLVDADLDTPSVHQTIVPPTPCAGLREMLADESLRLADTVAADVLPNLSILYAGVQGAGADGLVADRFLQIAERCLRDYEFTIFDTSPSNRSSGSRCVCLATGYALIVACRDITFADDILTLEKQLEQDGVSLVGSVLNRA